MNTRDIVYKILLETEKDNAFLKDVLEVNLRKVQFEDKKDRAFITRLSEGVTERKLSLDFLIRKISKTPFRKLKIEIITLIRMGLYQIIYMDSVPDRAAISEIVELAKKHKLSGLSGYINALLRTASKLKQEGRLNGMLLSSMEVRYSTPEWLCRLLVNQYGKEIANKILSDQFDEHPTSIRVNSLRTDRNSLIERLNKENVKEIEKGSYSDKILKISGYDHIRSLPSFREGLFIVQDESSAYAVERLFNCDKKTSSVNESENCIISNIATTAIDDGAANIVYAVIDDGAADTVSTASDKASPDIIKNSDTHDVETMTHMRCIDLCAAPGGKSLYAAELLMNRVTGDLINSSQHIQITSRDISKDKTELICENAERLGIKNLEVEERNATELDSEWIDKADYVIADVPCSGLGVMSRKNDIKYHVTPESLESLAELGLSILKNAASYVKSGGRILYSTCTINQKENQETVRRFLDIFSGTSERSDMSDTAFRIIEERTFLQGIDKCDGFYYCIIEKM